MNTTKRHKTFPPSQAHRVVSCPRAAAGAPSQPASKFAAEGVAAHVYAEQALLLLKWVW